MITTINEFKLINERFLTISSNNDKFKYIDIVWDILQTSYKSIGGFLGADDKQDLINKTGLWKLVRKNDIIVTAVLYKDTKYGRKLIGGGSDGSKLGKLWLFKILQEDINLKDRNAWSEVSGKLEEHTLKMGAIPIPNIFAKELLNKEIKNYNSDGFHYTRNISGIDVEKMIIGNIDL